MFGRYVKKLKRFWNAISPYSRFNLFKNVCEKFVEKALPIATTCRGGFTFMSSGLNPLMLKVN